MHHRARFLELQSLLLAHQDLWRPSPFHVRQPEWCARQPALAEALQSLDAALLDHLSDDPAAAHAWLAPRLPVVDALAALCQLPPLATRSLAPCSTHFDWSIPGRKREQIEAFAAHVPGAQAPLLEWCAGKGHLGRRLALADDVQVTSIEIDPALCATLARLARRAGVEQTALCADALAEPVRAQVRGREVLALHACGELHRTLVRGAAQGGALGYRIAPCCYDRGTDGAYRPLSREAALPLDAGELRLAVTESVTAPRHARLRLARDQAWKLGFVALRDALEGEAVRPFRPVPSRWLSGDFATFCTALAQREKLRLPAALDWTHWLAAGQQRREQMRRFELVRHAFRRALETWLVMDLALGLEEAGFEVRAGAFCPRSLTPRNLMLLARRTSA